MCGITGKVSFAGKAVTEAEISAMNQAIAHRGPDDSGVFISPRGGVGLGHRRLAIIDLSPLGHQPMGYLGRYRIVFNGEIYNFQEKRAMLEKEGYAFASRSDTEVLLALYDKYRENCLEHLRGMFAFAIYDEQEDTIFCARDRIGKKPFKYYLDDKVFLFASELKSILTQPEYRKEPDFEAIGHYLTLQYCPAPFTGFKNIHKLEPAHYLRLDIKTGTVEKKRYWKLDYSKKLALSEQEWQVRIMAKLEESVRLRMISDVPLGAFLSGGIDSSAIVAIMSRLSSRPVKTFSIGFKEDKYNELPYARMIAEKFGTDHTEFIVEPEAIKVLSMLVRQYEEPYADSSALPTYYVSKLTREHVTVALNGDGGDENFAGYGRYEDLKRIARPGIINFLGGLLLPLIRPIRTWHRLLGHIHRRLAARTNYRRTYAEYVCHFRNDDKARILTKEFLAACPRDSYDLITDRFGEAGTRDRIDQVLYTDCTTYLPDDLMVKVDIASMAVALEGRSPLLDHEFMELAAQIPGDLKLKGARDKKYIFKQALEGILPDEVLHRPKMGFGFPIDEWLRHDLKDFARKVIMKSHPVKQKIFRMDELEKLLDAHAGGESHLAYKIWNLLVLGLWLEEFFA